MHLNCANQVQNVVSTFFPIRGLCHTLKSTVKIIQHWDPENLLIITQPKQYQWWAEIHTNCPVLWLLQMINLVVVCSWQIRNQGSDAYQGLLQSVKASPLYSGKRRNWAKWPGSKKPNLAIQIQQLTFLHQQRGLRMFLWRWTHPQGIAPVAAETKQISGVTFQ